MQAFVWMTHFHDSRRVADDNRARWHRTRNHGSSSNDRVFADFNIGQYDCAGADKYAAKESIN